ncbi:Phospholipid diacylglycerol acyltransferase [Ceratocystis lukuohia]|uniref:Phospholipid diacylglycerol acyltransferase n=1 Tax=Ceratocystis lukuohia TaxID=2019550 RepID=A0ABR4MG58_9PEZI
MMCNVSIYMCWMWFESTTEPNPPAIHKSSQRHAYANRSLDLTSSEPKNFTIDDTMDYLYSTTEEWYRNMVKNSYSKGAAYSANEVNANENDPSKWINSLETRLPLALSLKIYCFYRVGKATERAYYYKKSNSILNSQPNITIDTSVTENHIDYGVIMGEGDGTVNLLSTGYMCNKGWKMPRYNSAGAKVTVVELLHNLEAMTCS